MAYCRSLTMLIWFASLALLCSFQAQAAELDETLSYIDTFDYSDTPAMGEYDYEPIVDIPETNKPTVTEPTETPGKDDTVEPPTKPEPKPEPEPEPASPEVGPGITIDQGNVTVPGAENITNTIIANLPNTTADAMIPQPVIPVQVETVAPAPSVPVIPSPIVPLSPSPPSSSSSWMVSMPLAVGMIAMLL